MSDESGRVLGDFGGDVKEKGKGIPGELPASMAIRDSLVGGQESFRVSPEYPWAPRGHRTCKEQCHALLGVCRVDGGMLRTPEFKVKLLWD